ncbi:MAG: MBL fold metallo-hydrolase [Acidimicrobiales bacterium]
MMEIEFFGVRGSTPCSCSNTMGHGGNTSCVMVRIGDEPPIICDLGTGARYYGNRLLDGPPGAFRGTALVTHLHWDHVQGLPFFVPLLRDGAHLQFVGPEQENGQSLEAEVCSFVRPPLFPIELQVLPGQIDFVETSHDRFDVGSASVLARAIPHVGPTNGYRIDAAGASMAYLPDHQQPMDGSMSISDGVRELCDGVDVLIHDAQYDAEEFASKLDWGHSTAEYAVEVARQCGVRHLVLFHHDPMHDDDWIKDATERAEVRAAGSFQVSAAFEGLTLRLGR